MQGTIDRHSANFNPNDIEGEMDLVAIWLRKDPTRWIAGVLAGLVAGLVMLVFAGLVSTLGGMEFLFPVKLMSTAFLGYHATAYGFHLGPVIIGLLLVEVLAAFLGFLYAHFSGTNALGPLLALGLVWGTFSWIFIWNLFLPAVRPIKFAGISNAPLFPICIVFGLSLTSVAFFDRAIRGRDL